jgi:hypothetical protein
MLHPSENTGKSLNEKQHLISRLYTTISAQKKNIYENPSKLIADLIWQLQNKNVYSVAKIEMLRNNIAQTTPISGKGKKNPLFQYQDKAKQWTVNTDGLLKMNGAIWIPKN